MRLFEDVRTRFGIGEIRKLIEGTLLMKTNVKSLAFACGVAMFVFSWGAGTPAHRGLPQWEVRAARRVSVVEDSPHWPASIEHMDIRPRRPRGVLQSSVGPRAQGPDQLRAFL